MGRAVCDSLSKLEERNRHLVYSFLHHTKCTMFCEILNPATMHIVNLHHLAKPEIHVIAVTPTVTQSKPKSLCAVPPHHTLDLVIALGFKSTTYEIISSINVIDRKNKVSYKTQ